MGLRKFLFWCHLTAGLTAGVVILIMSVTGVLLTYERQITAWADTRDYDVAPPGSGATRLSMEALVDNVRRAEPNAPLSTVTVRADPAAPVGVGTGQRTIYVHPYTGDVMGEGSRGVRGFFRAVTDWHRWLALGGERRAIGRAVTGACNLAFLLIVASGFCLWWPRTWTRQHLRTVTLFHGRLRGKARDFKLAQRHRVLVGYPAAHHPVSGPRDAIATHPIKKLEQKGRLQLTNMAPTS